MIQLGLGLMLFTLSNLVFVGLASRRGLAGLSLGVQSLRFLIWVVTKILYMPLFHLLINIIRCEVNREGDQVLTLFPEVYCYSGEHLVYSFLAGVAGVILAGMSLVTAYFYFENNIDSINTLASRNGHHEVLKVLFLTSMSIVFTLFNEDRYSTFRLLCLFAGTMLLFEAYHLRAPFYHYQTQRF